MAFISLLVSVLGAVGTWIQVVVQWQKSPKPTMNAEASSYLTIPRRGAFGILTTLVIWSVATGYLGYRVMHPPSAIDRSKVIATFNGNGWGIVDDRHSAFIQLVSSDLGPEADHYRIIGIAVIADAKVDINTDTRINRSSEFTVVAGPTHIEIPLDAASQRRLKAGAGVDILAVALPREYGAAQLTTISKLQAMHGLIVAHGGVVVPKSLGTK